MNQNLSNTLVLERYLVKKQLGYGSFGFVYEAEDLVTKEIVALKFDSGKSRSNQLEMEAAVYKALDGSPGIPKFFGYHTEDTRSFISIEKLGPSLDILFRHCDHRFTLKTVLMLADQMLRIIENFHNSGLVHRDIKPNNWAIKGRNLYLLDYGISAWFVDRNTGVLKLDDGKGGFVATALYASIHTHLGEKQSRRDDLESIGYILVRFLKGKLPWEKIKEENKTERNQKIYQSKMRNPPQILCDGLPDEFRVYFEVVGKMQFEEQPKYYQMRRMFKNLFLKKGFVYDNVCDWDDDAPRFDPTPFSFLEISAAHFQRINETKEFMKQTQDELVFPMRDFLCMNHAK